MFALIAVNTATHGGGTAYITVPDGEHSPFPGPVFHYHVPLAWSTEVVPGMLVEVPFGARQVQGIVVALSEISPVTETRPLTRIVFEGSVLDPWQIELGLWLSRHYLTPLIDCLRLMLPPGMLRRPRAILRLHPETPIPEDLPDAQQQVVDLLRRYGTLPPGQIVRRAGRQAKKALRALLRQGIVIQGSDLPAPGTRPKRVRFVRLLASPPQVEDARPILGRPSKQAAVLEALLDGEDPLPSPEQIVDRAGTALPTLATMAKKGWIERVPEQDYIQLVRARPEIDLSDVPQQQVVMAYLKAQNEPVALSLLQQAVGASAAVLRAMLDRNLIERVTEPAAVLLRLDRPAAQAQIAELRGAVRQHQVLDYLLSRPAGEWIWVSWIYAETEGKLADLRALESHGLIELAEREVWRDPLAHRTFVLEQVPRMTPDQERVWAQMIPHLQEPTPQAGPPPAFLLHGVTGSGKTEIYLRAVQAVLDRGQQAIVLVPEISLTPQTIRRFSARFPNELGVIHSGLSDGERYDTWRRLRAGQIRLIVGPRSALFAPASNLGLIVIDEEHESTYKSDMMPTYHVRDVALHLAQIHRAVVLLGSATPDLVTYYRASETHEMRLLELPQRILGHREQVGPQLDQADLAASRYRPFGEGYEDIYTADLPPVHVVDMRHELRAGNRSIFSRILQQEMERALDKREQIILFLNRRGASTFVMCRDCGAAIRCPHCNVPLTFHLHNERLSCHHCNHQQAVPQVCPICGSRRIRYFGVGTQRVEAAVHDLLPGVRTLRWDQDTTRERGSHQALLDRFAGHRADVLIGTQMIAKGLDLPLVTLVGVISADTSLNLPDFRAAERSFQLLEQIAGRAGRGPRGGQVIVQTYTPEHDVIQAAAQHDYAAFYRRERAFRHQMGYPPFSRLARLLFSDPDPARCREQAQALAHMLAERMEALHIEHLSLIGPAPCFFVRLRGRWRWQIILRALGADDLDRLLAPLTLPPGWQLELDPLDIL